MGLGVKPKTSSDAASSPTPYGFSKEETDLLDGLGQDVSILKQQASLHKAGRDEQNKHLDALNQKADKVQNHLEKTNRKVKDLL